MVELRNSTLTNIKGQQATNPDLTITVNRTDLESVMGGTATFDDLLKAGKAKFVGDRKPFDQLRGMLVQFDPIFEILLVPLQRTGACTRQRSVRTTADVNSVGN